MKGVQLTQLEQFSVQQSVSHGQVEQVTRVPGPARAQKRLIVVVPSASDSDDLHYLLRVFEAL